MANRSTGPLPLSQPSQSKAHAWQHDRPPWQLGKPGARSLSAWCYPLMQMTLARIKIICAVLMVITLLPSISQSTPPARDYAASKEREERILRERSKIKPGMDMDEVKQILGQPDGTVPSVSKKEIHYQYYLEIRGNPTEGYDERYLNIKTDSNNKVVDVKLIESLRRKR